MNPISQKAIRRLKDAIKVTSYKSNFSLSLTENNSDIVTLTVCVSNIKSVRHTFEGNIDVGDNLELNFKYFLDQPLLQLVNSLTDEELNELLFGCFLHAEIHEAKEQFIVNKKQVYDPHAYKSKHEFKGFNYDKNKSEFYQRLGLL